MNSEERRIKNIAYQHSVLAWWKIKIKTFVKHSFPFTFIVSVMTFTTILFSQSPDDVNYHNMILLT